MTKTENFNLNIVEGSDKVNLLTQMNPNTVDIDLQMFKNQNSGVQTATELLSGTVHGITRNIPDAPMIRFTAVSRFTAGDTFTVDGVQVSALLPSGEQLPDGAFIIGSEVLCVLKGTLLTVFASGGAVAIAKDAEMLGGNLPEYYATKDEVKSAKNTATSAGEIAESNKLALGNGNIMFDVIDDNIMWKTRGADTFNPFSSGSSELIWEIPSGTTSLSALNVDFNMNNYSGVIILSGVSLNAKMQYFYLPKGSKNVVMCPGNYGAENPMYTETFYRKVTVNDNGINISTAYYRNEAGVGQQYAIPMKIFAIKGVEI